MAEKKSKVIIIGSGPAGYTAAIYAARAMLEPILIEGIQPGGQLTITTDVENYPGFADIIQGPWLMDQMRLQAKNIGVEVINDHINLCNLSKYPFQMNGDSGTEYIAESIIICTGAQAKWLGLETEEKFKGFGVSACATCDGFFYKDKTVVVVGGGNTAVEVGRVVMRGGNDEILDDGKFIVIWKKENDGWRLHRDIVNSSLPSS